MENSANSVTRAGLSTQATQATQARRDRGWLEQGVRGLWSLLLFIVVVVAGLVALTFGFTLQFESNTQNAWRITLGACGAGIALLTFVVGTILLIKYVVLASSAHHQRALETMANSNQKAMEALTHQVELSNVKTDAVVQTLAQVFTSAMGKPQVLPLIPIAEANTQQQLPPALVINYPKRRKPWMYPILRDGKTTYARGDLIEHFVRWGMSDDLKDDETSFRDYMRKKGVMLSNEQPGLVKAALEHEGALLPNNQWAKDEQGVWEIVHLMRERGVQP